MNHSWRWPGLGRLDLYLIEELVPLILAGLLVLILLFMLAALIQVLAPILAKGASAYLIARLLAFSIPPAIGQGLPIALLFAVLLVLSRMASEAEIKALLAGGIAPVRLLLPVLILSLAVALLSFFNNQLLVPRASLDILRTQRQIILEDPRVLIRPGTVFKDAAGRAIYVRRIGRGGQLGGITIVQMAAAAPPSEVITARNGTLSPSQGTLALGSGQRISYQNGRPVAITSFQQGQVPVSDLQGQLGGLQGQIKPVDLPLGQLRAEIAGYQAHGVPTFTLETALQRKFAEPLASVAFGFFAVALALFGLRSGSGLGLAWVLILTFAYYATWSVFKVMGAQGAIPPLVAAWAPDLLYSLAGGILLSFSFRN